MDSNQLKELAAHYVAMILLAFGAIVLIRVTVGELDFWIEVAVVFVVVFGYRPVVLKLGIAPSNWEQQ